MKKIITMIIAVLGIHIADSFIQKDMTVFYLVAYVFLFFAASEEISTDRLLKPKQPG